MGTISSEQLLSYLLQVSALVGSFPSFVSLLSMLRESSLVALYELSYSVNKWEIANGRNEGKNIIKVSEIREMGMKK